MKRIGFIGLLLAGVAVSGVAVSQSRAPSSVFNNLTVEGKANTKDIEQRGNMITLPKGNPTFVNVHPLRNPQPDGVWVTPDGPYVDICSVGGCVDGPHILAQTAINVRTQQRATAQEVGWHLNFDANTG